MRSNNKIRKVITFCKIFILVYIVTGFSTSAMAVNSIWTDSPPEITGAYNPSDWDSTEILTFTVTNTQTAGIPIEGTMVIMNDSNNIYIKIECNIQTSGLDTVSSAVYVSFDNTNNHDFSSPEDFIAYTGWLGFSDGYDDGDPHEDTAVGGGIDGFGSFTSTAVDPTPVWRLSHPLNSGDSFDFARIPGDAVGYTVMILLEPVDVNGYDTAITEYPAVTFDYPNYGEIILATPPTIDSGWTVTPPAITGAFAPSEWGSAGSATFDLGSDQGGSTTGTMYVMNDDENLYIAIVCGLTTATNGTAEIYFDNNNDGLYSGSLITGEDVIIYYSSGTFFDGSINNNCDPGPPCLWDDGGTTEGSGSFEITEIDPQIVFRLSHPLNSGDPYDFALSPGDIVGFTTGITIGQDGSPSVEWTANYPATSLDEYASYGDIVLATNCQGFGGDSDKDGICGDDDPDLDNDGIANTPDNCPDIPNPLQGDLDDDGVGDVCDNCPSVMNAGQDDGDGDLVGDVCEETSHIITTDLSGMTLYPGAPFWVTTEITIAPYFIGTRIFKPDCFNTYWYLEGAEPLCRRGPSYGIPDDLVEVTEDTIFKVTCDLNTMFRVFPPLSPTSGDPSISPLEVVYTNAIQDPDYDEENPTDCTEENECYKIWTGSIASTAIDITMGDKIYSKATADVNFTPDEWVPPFQAEPAKITVTITDIRNADDTPVDLNDVDLASIKINGSTQCDSEKINGSIFATCLASDVLENLVTVLPGQAIYPMVQGALKFNGAGDIYGYFSGSERLSTVMRVSVDIKPGAEPNSINLGSNGSVPVAILSSDYFDATTVDPGTVTLAGASVKVKGKGNRLMSSLADINGDGLKDLMVHVDTVSLELTDGEEIAVIEGFTYSGLAIIGSDTIRIVP